MSKYKTTLFIIASFILMMIYAVIRYHFGGGVPAEHIKDYIFNKALAFTAANTLGFAFLLGSLKRAGIKRFENWQPERMKLGKSGLWLASLHVFFSVRVLDPKLFKRIFTESGWLNAYGIIGIIFGSFALSIYFMINFLPGANFKRKDKFMQLMKSGKIFSIAMLMIFAHLIFIENAGWFDFAHWYFAMPPITLVSIVILLLYYFGNKF